MRGRPEQAKRAERRREGPLEQGGTWMRQGSWRWQRSEIGEAPEPIHGALGRQGFLSCYRFPRKSYTLPASSERSALAVSGRSCLTGLLDIVLGVIQ